MVVAPDQYSLGGQAKATGQTADSASSLVDEVVSSLLETFQIPGASVALVLGGEPVLAKGFGSTRLSGGSAVDQSTLFMLGSNAKGFTAAAVLRLVERGGLQLDDRVEDLLPEFRLEDAYASRLATVRDLLAHRTGLGGLSDLLFIPPSGLSRRELVRRLRWAPPASEFRAGFDYSNLGYVAAGEVIAEVSNSSWDDVLREELLKPLEMNRSTTCHGDLLAEVNRAEPHMKIGGPRGELVTIAPARIDNAAAAGGLASSAEDMLQWLLMLTNAGRAPAGGQVMSVVSIGEMFTPQVVMAIPRPPASISSASPEWAAYGLGYRLYGQRGVSFARHGGNIYGYSSLVVVIPERRVGLCLLANTDDVGDGLLALQYALFDYLFGWPTTDWVAAYAAAREERLRPAAAVAMSAAHSGPHDLHGRPGLFRDPWFGDARVTVTADGLHMAICDRPGMEGRLQPTGDGSFCVQWADPMIEPALVRFDLSTDGAVIGLSLAPASPFADESFSYQALRFAPMGQEVASP